MKKTAKSKKSVAAANDINKVEKKEENGSNESPKVETKKAENKKTTVWEVIKAFKDGNEILKTLYEIYKSAAKYLREQGYIGPDGIDLAEFISKISSYSSHAQSNQKEIYLIKEKIDLSIKLIEKIESFELEKKEKIKFEQPDGRACSIVHDTLIEIFMSGNEILESLMLKEKLTKDLPAGNDKPVKRPFKP